MLNHTGQFSNLPVPRTALIGRERDLAAIRSISSDPETRLLTLSGVGGCGKTRLALQLTSDLSADYPQRTWAIELAAIADPELIPIVAAEAIGLQESGSTSSVAALTTYLQTRPALLLLDNCEHLVDACATFTDTLLASCPDLRVIATSREPLHIPGERQYRVPPLDIPDIQGLADFCAIEASPAVQLFVTRAQAVLPAFELTPSNADGVARICARLEGIPLALELAAARVLVLGVEQILARLDDFFHLLTSGSRVAPTRHQTLRATLEWSDDLLTESERTVFRRLAVFAGEFRLEAAEAICSDGQLPAEALLEIVGGLADKSLIVTESGVSVAWYRLLEPVRQYALELLDAHGERAMVRSRHATYYLELAERAAAELRGPEQARWLEILAREQGNLRAALEWAVQTDSSIELRLAVALAPFWEIHSHLREGLRRLRAALEHNQPTDDLALHMRALAAAGRLALYFDDSTAEGDTEAAMFSRESLRLARELDDDWAIAAALRDLGMIYRVQRDYTRSIVCLEEAFAIFQSLDDEPGAMRVLLHLGLATYRAGKTPTDRATATRMFQESLNRLRTYGDRRIVGIAQVLLGQTAQDRGDLQEAIRLITAGMSTHRRLNDRWLVTSDLLVLSEVLLDAGYPRQAVQFVAAARALSDQLGGSVDRTSFADITGILAQIDTLRQEAWFATVWEDGYALGPREAVLAARALLDEPEHAHQQVSNHPDASTPLTPRELEVARLLAEDHTDRQIADALFIAPSTVATHVHHILQKLNVRSRVQVADWLAMQPENPADPA